VFLPMSLPGVVGGALLVFILAVGYFITPRLLGGPRDQMIAMVIEEQVELGVDWGFASALSIILLLLTTAGFILYDRVVGLKTLLESKV
jgi:putative spermidine/putrescine transport system permease protein